MVRFALFAMVRFALFAMERFAYPRGHRVLAP